MEPGVAERMASGDIEVDMSLHIQKVEFLLFVLQAQSAKDMQVAIVTAYSIVAGSGAVVTASLSGFHLVILSDMSGQSSSMVGSGKSLASSLVGGLGDKIRCVYGSACAWCGTIAVPGGAWLGPYIGGFDSLVECLLAVPYGSAREVGEGKFPGSCG
jgi:hypothetical protein